jgi:hypothetical protein
MKHLEYSTHALHSQFETTGFQILAFWGNLSHACGPFGFVIRDN